MFKGKFNFKLKILILILFFISIFFAALKNQSLIIKKAYQIAPNTMNKARFFYFNLPHNLPNIPSNNPIKSDLEFKKNLKKLVFKNSYSKNINIFGEMKKMDFYMPKENYLLSGISNIYAGSSYIDFLDSKLIILSARGLIAYGEIKENEISLKQIKNNLNNFLGIDSFEEDRSFSFKDILIFNNKIYVTLTDEISNNCWTTSVLYSDINFENLNFKYLFKPKECVNENNDEAFVSVQSGGRLTSLDEDNLLLSTGEFRYRKKAQDLSSIFGKIININLDNGEYNIVSMGHRNPQGLFVDQKNKIILSTEHGPWGGDEINLIPFEKIYNNEILNFGWPISSYGEHYAKKNARAGEALRRVDLLYKKYPLHKSHKEYGFREPIYYFTPSIGISEITGLGKSKYISSSLGSKKLFFFKLDQEKKISEYHIETAGERVRDIIFKNNKLILFLEDTATIGIINY